VVPDIASAKRKYDLSDILCYMTGNQDEIVYHRPQAATSDGTFHLSGIIFFQ